MRLLGRNILSKEPFQILSCHFHIPKNLAQQPGPQRFTGMHGDHRGAPVWMSQKPMASPRPDNLKPSPFQCLHEAASRQSPKATQTETL